MRLLTTLAMTLIATAAHAAAPSPTPPRGTLTLEAITATYDELMADRAALVRAQIALDIIRDKIGNTEHRFHGQMRGSKDSVRGQYGDDSNELAAMGLKKASEKKRGSSRGKPAEE